MPQVLSVPALSKIPSLSGSSGIGSVPSSGLCTPNDDLVDARSAPDFFPKMMDEELEDISATPRAGYGEEKGVRSLRINKSAAGVCSTLSKGDFDILEGHASQDPDLPASVSSLDIEGSFDDLDVSTECILADLSAPIPDVPSAPPEPWTARRAFLALLRTVLFVPWCTVVGGAICLSPRHLELVTFSTGYVSSERGPRRFGYWVECAVPHIMIFLASLATLVWWDLRCGTWVVAAALTRCIYEWQDFRVDLTTPLGEDERQSLYLAVTKVYLQDGFVMRVPNRDRVGVSRVL